MLGFLVVFRFTFASIYILGWKFRYNCMNKYKIKEVDLMKQFKNIKKNQMGTADDNSSDDNEIENQVT